MGAEKKQGNKNSQEGTHARHIKGKGEEDGRWAHRHFMN
jgi:hypothetical protein